MKGGGGNPDVKHKPEDQKPKDAMERKLEQGLEESMTGSYPVSVTQSPKANHAQKGLTIEFELPRIKGSGHSHR